MSDVMAVSVRIEKIKDWNSLEGQRRHDFREKVPDYVDKSRSGKNIFILDETGGNIREAVEKGFQQFGKKIAKNAVLAYRGILTFSKLAQERISVLGRKEIEKRFFKSLEALSQFCDGAKIIYAVWHRDETAPHLHFVFLPFSTKTKRSLNKTAFSGRDQLSKLQDAVASVWKDLGIGRGKAKAKRIQEGEDLSKIVHMKVKELHEDLFYKTQTYRSILKKASKIPEARISRIDVLKGIFDPKEIEKKVKRIIQKEAVKVSQEIDQERMKLIRELQKESNFWRKRASLLAEVNQELERENEKLKKENERLRMENSFFREELKKFKKEVKKEKETKLLRFAT